jgi:hypothetical protein
VLAVGQHDPPDRDLVHRSNGLPDHCESVVADLAVGPQVVGTDQVAGVDLIALDEFVDLDGAGGFQRELVQLFLADLDEVVFVERIGLDDVLVRDLLASVGVHFGILDPVAGFPVELVERDLLGFRGGRVQRDGTGDERKAQEAFPVRAGGPWTRYSNKKSGSDSRRTNDLGSDIRDPVHRINFRFPVIVGLDSYVLGMF